jgi:hypothetical protein
MRRVSRRRPDPSEAPHTVAAAWWGERQVGRPPLALLIPREFVGYARYLLSTIAGYEG